MGGFLPLNDSRSRPTAKKFSYVWQCVGYIYSDVYNLLTIHSLTVGTHRLLIAVVAAHRARMPDVMHASFLRSRFGKGYPVTVLSNSFPSDWIWTSYNYASSITSIRLIKATPAKGSRYRVQNRHGGEKTRYDAIVLRLGHSTAVVCASTCLGISFGFRRYGRIFPLLFKSPTVSPHGFIRVFSKDVLLSLAIARSFSDGYATYTFGIWVECWQVRLDSELNIRQVSKGSSFDVYKSILLNKWGSYNKQGAPKAF